MIILEDFFLDLCRQGVRLRAEGERLRLDAPRGVLTREMKRGLRRHKSGLLQLLNQAQKTTPESMRITARPRGGEVPLSFAQQRLWFLDRLEGGGPAYHISSGLRFCGRLHLPALELSLAAIVARHETLRTTFEEGEEGPLQRVGKPWRMTLATADLARLSPIERERLAQDLASLDFDRCFDLAVGPLLRFLLLRFSADEHLLLITLHHIISDGWSLGVFTAELTARYGAAALGKAVRLPRLPIQYADFAIWQRDYLSGERLETLRRFWISQLEGAPALLELPTDRPRPSEQSFAGGAVWFRIDGASVASLKRLHPRATLFMLLQAGFALLLARYSGQDDIVIGTPVANRNFKEIEPLIGFFVNTLPIRCKLHQDPDVTALLDECHDKTAAAFAHQDLPFELMVEALQPERNLGYAPLFQAMCVLQNAPLEPPDLPGLSLSGEEREQTAAKFDLSLAMVEREDGLHGSLEYNADLWEEPAIRRMAGHYQAMLRGMARQPARRVSRIALLTGGERKLILEKWNRPPASHRVFPCVHRLFETQVRRSPDAVALVCRGRRLSFLDLNRLADGLAPRLQALGIGAESMVGIHMPRAAEMIAALLAVLKAGGAYVPMDPAWPRERLWLMASESRLALLLTGSGGWPGAARVPFPILVVDEKSIRAIPSGDRAGNLAGPDNLSHVIFTSGSTGKPKGVAIRHGSVGALLDWGSPIYRQARIRTVLAATSICFDLSVFEIFGSLGWGLEMLLADTVLDALDLKEYTSVNLINTVPSAMTELARVEALPPALRVVNLAGEALRASLVRELLRIRPQLRIYNLYGPSEDTTYSTHGTVATSRDMDPSIGRPIDDTNLYTLDRHGRQTPLNVPGELFLAGVGLARGYLQRPEWTASRFVPNPFSHQPGMRLYRSGDRARYLPAGNLAFLGRSDHQIKLRGFRIELGEIEAVLCGHGGVLEAAVVMVGANSPNALLNAHMVARPGKRLNAEESRRWCAARLPGYSVPASFTIQDRLPRTPGGKVDRLLLSRRLPESRGKQFGTSSLAAGPIGQLLAEIWCEILHHGSIGPDDNFFELGGHSLAATRVVARVREVFRVRVPLREIFARPTLAEMTRAVEAALHGGGSGEPSAFEAAPPGTPSPLSFSQRRLWFLHQLEDLDAAYNMPICLELTGVLSYLDLYRGLNEIAVRHEVLRTRFVTADGEPLPEVCSEPRLRLTIVDAHILDEAGLRTCMEREARLPFNLGHAPLFRITLLKKDENRHLLLATLHHIVCDGWSLGVLVRELTGLYTAFCRGRPSPFAPLPIQYADFARWQRERLQGETRARLVTYWKNQLAGLPPRLDLPFDRPRTDLQSHRGGGFSFPIPAAPAAALSNCCRASHATLFMGFQAIFAALLGRYSGQDDIAVGTPIAGRGYGEIEPLIGFFLNTLVIRTRLDGEAGFESLLRQVRRTALDAYAHQELPFEEVVDALQPERRLQHAPLFQVMFIQQNTPGETLDMPGLHAATQALDIHSAKYDLTFAIEEGARLRANIQYNAALFQHETIERMADHFLNLLQAAVEETERSLSSIALLSPGERTLLLWTWNQTERVFPLETCLHELFEAQAARSPHAIALVDRAGGLPKAGERGRHIGFERLNGYADHLADVLVRRGVGAEVFVAVCLERSLESVTALLAVFKAGGAYLPLDPLDPESRRAFMLADARPRLLLTRRKMVALFADSPVETLALEPILEDAPGQGSPSYRRGVGPDNTSYLIYTSGSTGKPKAVIGFHRSALNRFYWMYRVFPFGADERACQKTAMTFVGSVWDTFGAMLRGLTTVVIPAATLKDPFKLIPLLAAHRVTRFILTPVLLRALLESFPDLRERICKLRFWIVSGEALDIDLVRLFQHRMPDCRLLNLYGSSEVAADSTWWDTAGGLDPPSVAIGRPIDNTRVFILDGRLRLVARGVSGQICVACLAIVRGYLNRPGLTATVVVPNPYPSRAGERLYLTGDRGRQGLDGNLLYQGRLDKQVNPRGFRVEPGEIETALLREASIGQAVVICREDRPGERRLVAYLVTRGESRPPMPARLRTHLARHLPEYMIPAAFVFLPRLPMRANAKVDRNALPPPDAVSSERSSAPRPPRSHNEKALAEIWAELLDLPRVGIQQNFFDLGGDSILSIGIVVRARRAGLELTVRQIFAHQTVAALAAVAVPIAETNRNGERPQHGPDALRELRDSLADPRWAETMVQAYPLSPMQEGMLFHTVYQPGARAYFQQLKIELEGSLNPGALYQAWRTAVDACTVLRTSFHWHNLPRPIQAVHRESSPPWTVHDWRGLVPELQTHCWNQLLDRDRSLGFTPERPPLLRFHLVRRSETTWRLLFSHHHLILDGWSLPVLHTMVFEAYRALCRGEAASPPRMKPYKAYIDWLENRDARADEGFWREQLKGFEGATPLPFHRPKSAEGVSLEREKVALPLDGETAGALRELARCSRVTLNTIFCSAWAMLLGRYAGREDVLFGATVSGRPAALPGVETMVGLFINTLPSRFRIKSGQRLDDWLREIQESLVERESHGHTPLKRIREYGDAASGSPLFHSILVFENYPAIAPQEPYPHLSLGQVELLDDTDYPLSLMVAPGRDFLLQITFETPRFSPTAMLRLLRHLRNLLLDMARRPESVPWRLEMLGREERRELLASCQEPLPQRAILSVHQGFNLQVERRPDAVALIGEGKFLAYREVSRRAMLLGHRLRSHGVGPETPVALHLERSPEVIICQLAVLLAGGAFLPLDPDPPEARSAAILAACRPSLVISSNRTGSSRALAGYPILQPELPQNEEGERLDCPGDSAPLSAAAYIMFTSGSTGAPKGVAVSQEALGRHIAAVGTAYGLHAADIVLQFAAFHFDPSLEQVFGALCAGASIFVRGPLLWDAELCRRLLEQHRVTVANLPGAYWEALLGCWSEAARGPRTRLPLRLMIVGGDVMPRGGVRLWNRLGVKGTELWNVYGPTEATITACRHVLPLSPAMPVPIGRPLPGRFALVLDRQLKPLPREAGGDLFLGGVSLARGYHGLPELSAAAWPPDAFSGRPGARIYRTGDRAHWSDEGALIFEGRADRQIKLRGQRLEPGEIEAVLSGHPLVTESLVRALEDSKGRKRLVAYLASAELDRQPEAFTAETLTAFACGSLPSYMVPTDFVVLASLPRKATGKLDWRALPLPVQQRQRPAHGETGTRSAVEEILADIWRRVLGLKHAGLHDNFFELGGDSILSLQVVAMARRAGFRLTPKQIFEAPTIAGQAALCRTRDITRNEGEIESVTGEVPLTPIQARFLRQNRSDQQTFSHLLAFEIAGKPDSSALERTLALLADHHDMLRARFDIHAANGPRQWIQAPGEHAALVTFDLAGLSAENAALLREQLTRDLPRAIHLGGGPIFRTLLFAPTDDSPARLVIAIHHLVVDGVSWRILLEDLASAYPRLVLGLRPDPPPKTTSFQAWSRRLRAFAQTDRPLQQAAYWRVVEDEAHLFEAAVWSDFPGESMNAPAGGLVRVTVSLDAADSGLLLGPAQKAWRTRVHDLPLAALAQTLMDWTGRAAIVIDLEGHGRVDLFEDVDLSRTVGWFTTIFPLCFSGAGSNHPAGMIQAAKEATHGVPQQGIGYGLLRYTRLGDGPLPAKAPRAAALFNYLGQSDRVVAQNSWLRPKPIAADGRDPDGGSQDYPLEITALVSGGRFHATWSFGKRRFRPKTVERQAGIFRDTLKMLVHHCLEPGAGGYTPSDFPWAGLDQAALDRLTAGEGGIQDIYPLSPMQAGLMFHCLLDPESDAYRGWMSCILEGQLDAGALRRAWQTVVSRHEALRASFHWRHLEAPLQVIHNLEAIPWREEDWRDLPEEERKRHRQALTEEERNHAFDLGRAPLMRFTLVRLATDRHLLLWSRHHLLIDGWSLYLLFKEVWTLYGAYPMGTMPNLATPRPFRDFITYLQTRDPARTESFWRRELRGFRAPTPLPGSIPANRREEPGPFAILERRLGDNRSQALYASTRALRVTLSGLVQGAWALLLAGFSGEEDVLFGVTVAGRPADLDHAREMVGLFINTLPARVRVHAALPVGEWLSCIQTNQAVREQRAHTPLQLIQGWSEVPRGTPLFQCLLVVENYPVDEAPLQNEREENLKIRDIETEEHTHFPLTLTVKPGTELLLALGYDASRFEPAWIERLMERLVYLLELLSRHGRLPLSRLPLLEESQRRRLLLDWNQTPCEIELAPVQVSFQRQAARKPDAVALTAGQAHLTFAALETQASHLAARLRGLGIRQEDLVGIHMERSPEMVWALLAVLLAGGAYVPLDTHFPGERLALMAGDAELELILTGARTDRPSSDWSLASLRVTPADPPATTPASRTLQAANPIQLAYVMYTSGSTGRPKGVQVCHGALSNLLESAARAPGFDENDRLLGVTTISFDIAGLELYLPLTRGGHLVLAESEAAAGGASLARLLEDKHISVMQATPATWYLLQGVGYQPRGRLKILCGGEALPADLARQLRRWTGSAWNLYGPTETTIWSTVRPLRSQPPPSGYRPPFEPLGKPMANTGIFILDAFLRPVPPGAPGALYIGGLGLARGYRNRLELTALSFIPHPFAREIAMVRPGSRLYASGDLARFLGGDIEFLGRADRQLKVRGFRIECRDIEAVLEGHAAVKRAVVSVRREGAGDTRLLAFFTTRSEPSTAEAQSLAHALRDHARECLPAYMAPAALVHITELPLTANGKIDRTELDRRPVDSAGMLLQREPHQAPRTSLESELVGLWSDVLKLEKVGIYDHFFELGGHSLLGTQLISRLRDSFEVEIPLRALFREPTVAGMAAFILAARPPAELEPPFDAEEEEIEL